jgi:hypothetical protein
MQLIKQAVILESSPVSLTGGAHGFGRAKQDLIAVTIAAAARNIQQVL